MADNREDSGVLSASDSDSMDEEIPLKKARTRYVWHRSGSRWNRSRSRSCTDSCIPATHNNARCSLTPAQVQCPIVSWQTRQMARSLVDNTINQLREDMGFFALPENEEDDISLDAFPPVVHYREGIENAAVLMAIESHGLQKPCHCSQSYSLASSSPLQHIPFHHRPSTPLLPEPSGCPADACAPSTSNLQESYTGKSDFLTQSIGETDFLAQAVTVAIQKKGLGSYSPSELG